MVWFAAFGFAGWLFESVWAVLTQHHWESRGFLYGPICPIYGVGAVGALAIFKLLFAQFGVMPIWEVFLICMVGSAIMEYSISWGMEKAFGTVWWDYTNMPLNLNGRICLPASLLFGAAGVAVVFLLMPLISYVNALVPGFVFELLAIAITIALTIDATLTVTDITNLLQTLNRLDSQMNDRMEGIVSSVRETREGFSSNLSDSRQAAMAQLRETREGISSNISDSRQAAMAQLRETAMNLSGHQQAMLKNMRRFASKKTARAAQLVQEARGTLNERREKKK